MTGFVAIDPNCSVCIEDAGGGCWFLQVRDESGATIKRKLSADMCRMFAYHTAILFYEMTGKGCPMPQGMAAIALVEEPEAPSAPRVRTRFAPPPSPEAPTPRVRTRRGNL